MAGPVSVDERTFKQLEALQKKLAAEEAARGGEPPVDASAAVQALVKTVERNVPVPSSGSAPHEAKWLAAYQTQKEKKEFLAPIKAHDKEEEEHKHGAFERMEHALHGMHLGAGGFEAGGVGGFAGHISGNLGQFEELFKALGPVAGTVVAGLGALGAAALEASKALAEIRQASFATGGTPGQVGFARTIGAAVGMDAGGIAGLAHSFRQQISSDPLAMGRFAAQGIRELPRGFGTPPNEMAALLHGIEAVVRAPSLDAARRLSETAPQLEPFLQLRGNEEALQSIEEMAKELDEIASPEKTQKAVELRLAQEKLGLSWEHLTTLVGGPFVKALTMGVTGIDHAIEGWGMLIRLFQNPLGFLQDKVKEITGEKGEGKSVAEKQLEEAKKQTSELQALRQGTFGGGSHARSAIPAGLRGQALEQALNAQATRLGAF